MRWNFLDLCINEFFRFYSTVSGSSLIGDNVYMCDCYVTFLLKKKKTHVHRRTCPRKTSQGLGHANEDTPRWWWGRDSTRSALMDWNCIVRAIVFLVFQTNNFILPNPVPKWVPMPCYPWVVHIWYIHASFIFVNLDVNRMNNIMNTFLL